MEKKLTNQINGRVTFGGTLGFGVSWLGPISLVSSLHVHVLQFVHLCDLIVCFGLPDQHFTCCSFLRTCTLAQYPYQKGLLLYQQYWAYLSLLPICLYDIVMILDLYSALLSCVYVQRRFTMIWRRWLVWSVDTEGGHCQGFITSSVVLLRPSNTGLDSAERRGLRFNVLIREDAKV